MLEPHPRALIVLRKALNTALWGEWGERGGDLQTSLNPSKTSAPHSFLATFISLPSEVLLRVTVILFFSHSFTTHVFVYNMV